MLTTAWSPPRFSANSMAFCASVPNSSNETSQLAIPIEADKPLFYVSQILHEYGLKFQTLFVMMRINSS